MSRVEFSTPFSFLFFFLGGGGGRRLMRMRHGVPEIEMNNDCFHAEFTVVNLDL